MKIAVMGMGVAGSYLVSRLKNDHEVVGFERMDEVKHDSICAWGSIKSTMVDLCKKSVLILKNMLCMMVKNAC